MIVTFYSFKGGVGRSMALANVAEILADMGYKVIASDWDLEAPGLERYAVTNYADDARYRSEMKEHQSRLGLMDLLQDYKAALAQPADATASPTGVGGADFTMLGNVRVRRPSSAAFPVSASTIRSGSLRLLTAGRRDDEHMARYADAVRRFDWDEFYERWAGDAYMEFLRRDLVGDLTKNISGAADILLLDSRTGVTEHGGVCTHHLADLVIVQTAANDLNMEGAKWMVSALQDPRLTKLRGGRPIRVLPVASRIEWTAQHDELIEFRQRFKTEFQAVIAETVGNADEFALASEIPYMAFYSFHERVVAREPSEKREPKLYGAYRAIADGIVRCGVRSSLLREPTAQGIVASAPDVPADVRAAWSHDAFVDKLGRALALNDRVEVEHLCAELAEAIASAPAVYPAPQGMQILSLLRSKQYFRLVQDVAASLIECGQNAADIRRFYASALIEQGNLTAARSALESLLTDVKSVPVELAEARGLLARVDEQLYLDRPSSRSRVNLERAVNTYFDIYQTDPTKHLVFGIKTAALIWRAQGDGVKLEAAPDPRQIAQDILEQIGDRRGRAELTPWDCATAVEASLAMGREDEALAWLSEFVSRPEAGAFELSMLIRQLTTLWKVDATSEPGGTLLHTLRSALLKHEGRVAVETGRSVGAANPPLERVLPDPDLVTLQWYRTGLARAQGVVRIETVNGQARGTGFLIEGRALHASLDARPVLITCAHVISEAGGMYHTLKPSEAAITIPDQMPERIRAGAVIFSSPATDLDVTILALEGDARVEPLPMAKATPAPASRVYVIGYPGGRDLSLSLQDNVLIEANDRFVRYRAATEPGSGGSPVFNARWELIAVHHAAGSLSALGGDGTYEAGEGISIRAIVDALAAHLSSSAGTTTAR